MSYERRYKPIGAKTSASDLDTTGATEGAIFQFTSGAWALVDADSKYFRLDASNSPITGNTTIEADLILSDGVADTVTFNLDGTDLNQTFSGITDWNISGLGAGQVVQFLDGVSLRFWDSTNTDWVQLRDDGSISFLESSTNPIYIAAGNGQVFFFEAGQTQSVRIYDSTGLDYGAFSHDGTDFTLAHNNTTYFRATGADWLVNTPGLFSVRDASGTAHFSVNHSGGIIDVREGLTLRVRDSLNTDYADFSHDGADFNTTFTNTNYWDMSGPLAMRLEGGMDLHLKAGGLARLYEADDTTYVQISHDTNSTDIQVAGTGVAHTLNLGINYNQVDITGGTDLRVRDAGILRIYDSADTQYTDFAMSASQFTMTGTQHIQLTPAVSHDVLIFTSGGTAGLRIYDGGGTDYSRFYHDGTSFYYDHVNTANLFHWGFTGGVTFSPDDSNTVNASLDITSPDHAIQLNSTTDGDSLAFTLFNLDGVNNPRAGLFLDDTQGIWGLSQTWSSGAQHDFVIRSGGATYLTIDFTTALTLSENLIVDEHSATIQSAAGDAALYLKADTTNTVETANPFIRMEQDGNVVATILGMNGSADVDGQGNTFTGAGNNGFSIHQNWAGGVIDLGVNGSVGLRVDDNDRVYIGQDRTGYFEAVTGNYGSVQCNGAEGSSGTYEGFSIAGRVVFMESGAGTAGIYDDVNNRWKIRFDLGSAGSTDLYYGTATDTKLETQDNTATGATSSAQVRDHGATLRDVGFNILPSFNVQTSDTLEAQHCGSVQLTANATGYTLTLEASTSTDFPVNGITNVINAGTTDYTITEGTGTTLYYVEPGVGRTDTAGGCTIGPGGIATIWRQAAGTYYIWGSEISP